MLNNTILKFLILTKLFIITLEYTYDESLVMNGIHENSILNSRLINSNYDLFDTRQKQNYLEKDLYDKKFKLELTLKLIENTLSKNNFGSYLNELRANYMNEFFIDHVNQTANYNDLFSFKNERLNKLLNQTWFIHCAQYKEICLKECLKLSSKLNYKKYWCQLNRNNFKSNRLKREIMASARNDFLNFFETNKQNISDELLIKEILDELMKKNMNNNFAFINSLSDSIEKPNKVGETNKDKNYLKSAKCENGFSYGINNDECIDVNECSYRNQTFSNISSNCDTNALCINTFGSFKCKCKKGYVGDGTFGNCFSGKFCSGRFCKMNGECHYDNNLNGYRCRCMLNCMNGGKCLMTRYKYECKCPNNTTGVLCNETAQYRLFKVNYFNKINDLNSTENIKLSNLISLVEPNLNNTNLSSLYRNTNFEMLNLFKNYASSPKKENNEGDKIKIYETTVDILKEEKRLDDLLAYLKHLNEHDHNFDMNDYNYYDEYYY